ncbi:MAG: radical SAM protein, partial [Candidatus Riflebacteria bacterium]|nr:radical SAM protein [Candidatus Riflebacteria bacterium]
MSETDRSRPPDRCTRSAGGDRRDARDDPSGGPAAPPDDGVVVASSAKEWADAKRWNPFNSDKLLAQAARWKRIIRGRPLPVPTLVSIDPTNSCNLDCAWCNSEWILSRNSGRSLSAKVMTGIPRFLASWRSEDPWPFTVEAVCVGGGGEALLNPHTDALIEECAANGIQAGVVTNGILLDRHIEALSLCTWVGVSVDAGSAVTFKRLKGLPETADTFDRVVKGVEKLAEYARGTRCPLGGNGQGNGVSFKYLVHPENAREIHAAARIARDV